MKFFCFICLFTCLALSHNSQAIAQNSDNNTIVIANHIIPPYFYLDNGKPRGSNVDIAQLLATRMNKTVEFIQCPFVRCLALTKQGKADMMISIRKTAERENYLSYLSEPYQPNIMPVKLYLAKDSTLSINHYDDLKDLTIGVLRGGRYFTRFDQDGTLRKFETTSHTQLIDMLLTKRIDVFLANELAVKSRVDETTYKHKMKTASYAYQNEGHAYIAISKNSPLHQELGDFSDTLHSLITQGEIEKSLKKYETNL